MNDQVQKQVQKKGGGTPPITSGGVFRCSRVSEQSTGRNQQRERRTTGTISSPSCSSLSGRLVWPAFPFRGLSSRTIKRSRSTPGCRHRGVRVRRSNGNRSTG